MATQVKPSTKAPSARIPLFIDRLRAIPPDEKKRIWGLCMAEKKAIKKYRYVDGAELRGYSLSGIKNIFTAYRKAIQEAFGDHIAIDHFRLTDAEMDEFREDYRVKVSDDHTNLRAIDDEALVAIATEIAEAAETCDTMELAGALLLLTGRRPVEVLKTGVFLSTPARNHVMFGGQAKRRELETDAANYAIPVLAPPAIVLAAVKALRRREITTNLTNQGVNGRFSKYLGRAVARRFFDKAKTPLQPIELRKVYATISYAWYCPQTVSMNAHFAQVLGHSPLDLFTALSYVQFYPVGQKREFLSDHRNALADAITSQEAAIASEPDATQRGYIVDRVAKLRDLAKEL